MAEPIVAKDEDEGIHLLQTSEGNFNGEALVEVETEEDFAEVLGKNKEHIGKRYIEGRCAVCL